MTGNQNASERQIQKALDILYEYRNAKDLTWSGYQAAISKLRSSDPGLAKRIERTLGAFLKERFFPRRQIEWEQTSEGFKARLKFLPDNPHFLTDVSTIRTLLGLPSNLFRITPQLPLWQELLKVTKNENEIIRAIESIAVAAWQHIHKRAFENEMLEEDPSISPEQRDWAVSSASVDLSGETIPDWLRIDNEPLPTAPLEWSVTRLVDRYRLRMIFTAAISGFVLTGNRKWIENLEPVAVSVRTKPGLNRPGEFDVTIHNIDEYITKADWDGVWRDSIKPRQNELWHLRGSNPSGKRGINTGNFRRLLPLYHQMVQTNKTVNDIVRSKAFLPKSLEDLDPETIRFGLRELDALLKPVDGSMRSRSSKLRIGNSCAKSPRPETR